MRSPAIFLSMCALLVSPVLSSCTPDLIGAMVGHQPGGTIDLVSQSPSHISYIYTHSYSDPPELPIASQWANDWCQQFGRHALLVQNQRINLDRSTVTFSCQD